jgi:hypothetical protein
MSIVATPVSPTPTPTGNPLWLRSRKWDLLWISGSVLLMASPYAMYYAAQSLGFAQDTARNIVNGMIAFFIGGPHMYATHLRTTFDPGFRKRHPSILLAGIVIPLAVIILGVNYFIILLTFFFFWASIHVLHQIVFLVDCYNGRKPKTLTWQSKAIDYAVVLTGLYPVAMYRFTHNTFKVGSNLLYFPEFLKVDAVWWLASAAFAAALALFITKTWREFRNGDGNVPKTILISVTVIATFITPFFHELDVAFQGLNTWHSFQYLGLTWYINRLRYDRNELPAKVSVFARPGEWWRYYGFTVMMTIIAIGLITILIFTSSYTGLSFDQCYYIIVLSFLLTHYYHDHIIFTEAPDFNTAPAPARAQGQQFALDS